MILEFIPPEFDLSRRVSFSNFIHFTVELSFITINLLKIFWQVCLKP